MPAPCKSIPFGKIGSVKSLKMVSQRKFIRGDPPFFLPCQNALSGRHRPVWGSRGPRSSCFVSEGKRLENPLSLAHHMQEDSTPVLAGSTAGAERSSMNASRRDGAAKKRSKSSPVQPGNSAASTTKRQEKKTKRRSKAGKDAAREPVSALESFTEADINAANVLNAIQNSAIASISREASSGEEVSEQRPPSADSERVGGRTTNGTSSQATHSPSSSSKFGCGLLFGIRGSARSIPHLSTARMWIYLCVSPARSAERRAALMAAPRSQRTRGALLKCFDSTEEGIRMDGEVCRWPSFSRLTLAWLFRNLVLVLLCGAVHCSHLLRPPVAGFVFEGTTPRLFACP